MNGRLLVRILDLQQEAIELITQAHAKSEQATHLIEMYQKQREEPRAMPEQHYSEHIKKTPNVSRGTNKLEGVVFHHTAGSYEGAVAWLTDKRARASAHVVIARDGRRTVLAEDEAITWHAGYGRWRGQKNCNLYTLGVELELTKQQHQDDASLTPHQLASMAEYIQPRAIAYGWTLEDMTHHRAVDPGRKVDLSERNWTLVRETLREIL